MKRLIVAKAAQRELREELLYYFQRSPQAADQFVADLEKA